MLSEKFKITAAYIIVCLIWGSTWLAIKMGLNSFTPLAALGFRFTTSAIIFYVIIKIKKIEIHTDKLAIKIYLMLAFLSYIFPFFLVYWAEGQISSGLTSVLFGILPFFVVIFSHFMIPENKTGLSQWVGIIIGFTGLMVIFSKNIELDLGNDFLGMLAVFGAGIMQAFIGVAMKKHSSNLNPLALNFIPTLIAGPVLILAGFVFENSSAWKFDTNGILSFMYLALFGTVIAFSAYYWLLQRISVVILSLNSFITPIIAVILGCFILMEEFTIRDMVGSSFVLIGILFANFEGIRNYLKTRNSNFKI